MTIHLKQEKGFAACGRFVGHLPEGREAPTCPVCVKADRYWRAAVAKTWRRPA